MRVLVLMGRAADVGAIGPALRMLGERGHETHVVVDPHEVDGGDAELEGLCRELPSVRWRPPPALPFNRWSFLGRELRLAAEYLRRPGSRDEVPDLLRAALRRPIVSSTAGRWFLDRALHWGYRAIPRDDAVDAFLRTESFDLVLAVPAIEPGSLQEEQLRSARALGIPVIVLPSDDGGVARTDVVTAAEAASTGADRPERLPWWAPLVRPALARVAGRLARTERARGERTRRQNRLRQHRHAAAARRRSEVRRLKQRAEVEGALRRQQEEAELAKRHRARDAVAAGAYDDYRRVREWTRRILEADGVATVSRSDAEQQMLARLAHFRDATPATIAELRRWCEPLGGACVSDYADLSPELARRLRYWVGRLRRWVGPELLVQEPQALGGFGYDMRGELYNEDTLRFLKVLVALQDGAVLADCRGAARRRLVWEIGGGWGGFAYQFKTICPNVTYLITGAPELLLVSAVYLRAVLPGARCRFYGESWPGGLWDDWQEVDLIFAPDTALAQLSPPRIDLTLDLMALRRMGAERVCAHVQRAFDLGARYFYSLASLRWPAGEAAAIWRAIARLYWPQPVPARGDPEASGTVAHPPATETDYAHLVGWRRLRV